MGVIQNRKLSPTEYLKQLQMEYMAIKVRLLIYTNQKDLEWNTKALSWKKDIINSFATAKGFAKTVVNDLERFNQYANDFLQEGFPKFTYYEGKKNMAIFERLDFVKYYSKGTWVVIDNEKTAKVIYADFTNKTITLSIKVGNKIQKINVEYKRVKRKDFALCF